VSGLTLALLVPVLRLWKASLSVPWSYVGDTAFHAMVVQTSLERGWYLATPRLGAPLGHQMYDLPLGGETLQLVVMRAIAFLADNPFAVINVYYLLTFALVASSAYLVCRALGITRALAAVAGVLYAFLPYHFVAHGEAHLFLSAYYTVPLAALLLCWHLEGRLLPRRLSELGAEDTPPGLTGARLATAVAMCVIVGASSTYYAVFTLVLLALATVVEVARLRSWRPVVSAALVGGVISVTLAAGLLPTVLYQRTHGGNPEVPERSIDHAEMLGLRITALLAPRDDHRLAPLAELGERSRRVPFPSELGQSLGVVGVTGLVVVVGTALGSALRSGGGGSGLRRRLGVLTLLALLVGTVGGVSFTFALLGLEEVRAWNRLTVFIAFFALAGLASLADDFIRVRGRRWRPSVARPTVAAAIAGVLLVGVLDQTSNRDVPDYKKISNDFRSDRDFVRRLEAGLPRAAMVFQLPYMAFPEEGPLVDAYDYDLVRGYLHSDRLRWSYGAMRARPADWQSQWVNQPTDRLVAGLAAAGFAGIYLDRFGYVDRGAAGEGELSAVIGQRPSTSRDGRLAFFDLRPFARRLRADLGTAGTRALRRAVLGPPVLTWENGVFAEERDDRERWRSAGAEARLCLDNEADRTRTVTLRFRAVPTVPVPAVLRVGGPGTAARFDVPPGGLDVSIPVRLGPGRHTFTLTVDEAGDRPAHRRGDLRLRIVGARAEDPAVERLLGRPPAGRP